MKIKITLEKLYVTDNGDPSQETNGELYYSFKVDGKSLVSQSKDVTVQVVKTGVTPPLATSERFREAKTERLHPAGRLHMLR